MVVSRDDHQLFIADSDCIWWVSVVDHSYVKWLTTETIGLTSEIHSFNTLSLTSRRLLVTLWWSRLLLHQYDVTDRQLLCVVDLSEHVNHVYHMAGLWSVTKAHWRTSGSTQWVNCLAFVTAELRQVIINVSRDVNKADRQLLRVVDLSEYVKHVYHAVETTRGTFVVGHRGMLQNQLQRAGSELFSVCHRWLKP